MKRSALAAAGLLASAGSVSAQVDGQATWLWKVATQDGDAIVEPGETATVTLSLDMEPDFGDMGVRGFAGAAFDTIGQLGASNGGIAEWEVLNGLADLTGDQTTTDGVSLFGTLVGQLYGTGAFVGDDPIGVLTYTWATEDFSGYEVRYETESMSLSDQAGMVSIWAENDLGDVVIADWPVEEAAVWFQVVPAPATAAVLGLAGAGLLRRRRR